MLDSAVRRGEFAAGGRTLPRRRGNRDLPIRLLALLTLANGLLGIVHVLVVRFSELPHLFDFVLPFGLHHWGRSVTLLTGFLLTYLSLHLEKRRRLAWVLTIVVCAIAAAAHLGRGHHAYLGISPAVTGLLLLGFRKRFTVRSEPRSVAFGVSVLVASALVALAYGAAGFWLLDKRDFGINFRLLDAGARSLRELVLVGNADLEPRTRHAVWFLESIRLLGVAAGLVGSYSLFRPLAFRLRTQPHERDLVRGIVERHGTSSLDFFKTRPDKSYFFSPSQRSCIAYRAAWGVAVALGDPLGPAEELEPMLQSFLTYCADNGWAVAFHQVLPSLLHLYERLGLHVVKIGEEACIDLERFAASTAMRGTFQRVRRKLATQGYRFERHVPPHALSLLDEVEAVSHEWLSLPGRRERGFTLGRFERGYVSETPLCTLRLGAGSIVAFMN